MESVLQHASSSSSHARVVVGWHAFIDNFRTSTLNALGVELRVRKGSLFAEFDVGPDSEQQCISSAEQDFMDAMGLCTALRINHAFFANAVSLIEMYSPNLVTLDFSGPPARLSRPEALDVIEAAQNCGALLSVANYPHGTTSAWLNECGLDLYEQLVSVKSSPETMELQPLADTVGQA